MKFRWGTRSGQKLCSIERNGKQREFLHSDRYGRSYYGDVLSFSIYENDGRSKN
jgi:hypothetical protein